jgi:hypothetical protein
LVEFIVTGESLMVRSLHSQGAWKRSRTYARLPRRRDHRNSPSDAAVASAPNPGDDDPLPTLHPLPAGVGEAEAGSAEAAPSEAGVSSAGAEA